MAIGVSSTIHSANCVLRLSAALRLSNELMMEVEGEQWSYYHMVYSAYGAQKIVTPTQYVNIPYQYLVYSSNNIDIRNVI